MSSIYKLTAEQRELMNIVEAGEISEEDAADTFQMMEENLNEKLNDYNVVLRMLALDMENIESELARISRLKKEKAAQVESVKRGIIQGLTNLNRTKFDTGLYKGHIRKGAVSTQILNPSLIPPEYIETKISEQPNKAEIKKAIQAGESIPGCELVTGKESLVIK